jgi:hypothetical protein
MPLCIKAENASSWLTLATFIFRTIRGRARRSAGSSRGAYNQLPEGSPCRRWSRSRKGSRAQPTLVAKHVKGNSCWALESDKETLSYRPKSFTSVVLLLIATIAIIPELAIPRHIRFCWIVRSVRVACGSARKQVVAHSTGYHHRRGLISALSGLPFVLTISVIAVSNS